MVNYLATGARVLQDRLEEYGGVTVTYVRPNQFSFEIVAIPGRNPVDVVDKDGVVLRSTAQDFVFDIVKLQAGMITLQKTPLRGDEIVYQINGRAVVFVVSGEGFATSHYEPSDSYNVAWRVHTKADRVVL